MGRIKGVKTGPWKKLCKQGHDRTLPDALTPQGKCRACGLAATLRWQAQHRERANKNSREYYERHKDDVKARKAAYARFKRASEPHKHRVAKRMAATGWSGPAYSAQWAMQQGRCFLCDKEPNGALHADHCHTSGRPRGLLCNQCNGLLGFAGDNPDLLRAAADYLER
jgi:hypothetical protein